MKSAFTHRSLALSLAALAIGTAPLWAHEHDPQTGSQAQQRLDRDSQRIADREAQRQARAAEERARIEARAADDPAKAAEDLAKLEADQAKEAQKESEDLSKAQDDFQKDSAKEVLDAAEAAAKVDAHGEDSGSSREIADLGQSEGAEHDKDGFAVKQGELVALDLSATRLDTARAAGFRVIGTEHLETLQRDVVTLGTPAGLSAVEARDALQRIAPEATIDLVHYYGLNLTAGDRGRPIRHGTMRSGGGVPITVGLIDTAVVSHPGLGPARLVPWQAGNLPGAPTEHGTAVASLLAGGTTPTIYAANIFRGPAERPFTSADVIAEALEWMMVQGIHTINMSLAGPRNAILDKLIRDAIARNFVIVAAAGNGGPTAPPAYPAAVPGVIAVTAVDKTHRVYRYAGRGPYISLAAPGVDVVAANAHGGLARFTGTSFAAPHVTNWIARCRSAGNSAQVCRQKLFRAARDLGSAGFDEVYGYGVID